MSVSHMWIRKRWGIILSSVIRVWAFLFVNNCNSELGDAEPGAVNAFSKLIAQRMDCFGLNFLAWLVQNQETYELFMI